MPYTLVGSYKYKPNNPNKLEVSDCEKFMYALLKDVAGSSSNTLLNTAKVTDGNDENSSDINKLDPNIKVLIGFLLNTSDLRNTNLNAKFKDDSKQIQIVYSIQALAQKSVVNEYSFRQLFEEIINAVSDNYNSETSTALPYTVTLSNGKVLSTSLSNNSTDSLQEGFIDREDTTQPNYLTASINVVFTIINKT
jgi:hypothetical protein